MRDLVARSGLPSWDRPLALAVECRTGFVVACDEKWQHPCPCKYSPRMRSSDSLRPHSTVVRQRPPNPAETMELVILDAPFEETQQTRHPLSQTSSPDCRMSKRPAEGIAHSLEVAPTAGKIRRRCP